MKTACLRRALVAFVVLAATTTAAPAADTSVLAQRSRVVDFFRALDAVHNDPDAVFLQVQEMSRLPLRSHQHVDLYRIRQDGERTLITERIAADIHVAALRGKAGPCQATRFVAAAGESVAETLRATRNTVSHVVRAVPSDAALTFSPAEMRSCSAGTCQHSLPEDDAAGIVAELFPLTPASAFADKGTKEDDRTPQRRANDGSKPGTERRSTDDLLLSAASSDLCQQGVLIDPRGR